MKKIYSFWFIAIFLVAGCGLFAGGYHYGVFNVILMQDNPPMYAINSDGSYGKAIGSFKGKKGDTVVTRALHIGGLATPNYFLLKVDTVDVGLIEHDVVRDDDYMYDNFGNSFQLPISKDQTAWGRALYYVSARVNMPVEEATENYIHSRPSRDSARCSYVIVRIPDEKMVTYQISCNS